MSEVKETVTAENSGFFLRKFRSLRSRAASLYRDLQGEPTGPRFRFWLWVFWPAVLVVGLTVVARMIGFDYASQKTIFTAGGDSWDFGEHPFWQGLYEYGTIPAIVLVFVSITGFCLSWPKRSFRPWRRVFAYIFLLIALAPGVIVNFILKEYWGRPRPREVEGLGGHQPFERIFTIDPISEGKSFACGHATMGFIFFGGFFLLRRYNRSAAEFFLAVGFIFGGLLGLARMAQGGHFFTDVIWAGAICYFVAMGLYYLMGLDKAIYRPVSTRKPMPWSLRIGVIFAVLATLGVVAFASPYKERRNLYLLSENASTADLNLRFVFMKGTVDFVNAETFHITGEAYGHGVPTSKIAVQYYEYEAAEDVLGFYYGERYSGRFSEVNSQLLVEIPWGRTKTLSIANHDAEIAIELASMPDAAQILLSEGSGPVRIKLGESRLYASSDTLAKVKKGGEFLTSEKAESDLELLTEDLFSGEIEMMR